MYSQRWSNLNFVFKVIARTNELLENSYEQRRKQEKALEEKQEQINKLETNMKAVTGDVIKASKAYLSIIYLFTMCWWQKPKPKKSSWNCAR